jgi:hypothetical protein
VAAFERMERKFMGSEVKCRVRFGKQESDGKALLETSEIIFRGDFRLKIPFATIQSVKVVDGGLQLRTSEGVATFELGDSTAQKWRQTILHPKTRIEKLGIKPGTRVSLIGFENDDEEFVKELQGAQAVLTPTNQPPTKDCDCIFLRIDSKKQLAQVAKIAKEMRGVVALWIIYPKGQQYITEGDVLSAGRKAGLADIKVVGFSPTHTALRFVIPVNKRTPHSMSIK